MPSQIINYQCPACTGPLHFEGASGKLECEYCDSVYEVSEIEKIFRSKEEKAADAAADTWNAGELSNDWGADAEGMKTYICPSCGAELICGEDTAATCCPYCGNQTVVPGQFTGALKPEFLIPFKTDKSAAVQALKAHYKGKKLLPKSFVNDNHIDDIQGVYVPFWMFDSEAGGEMIFEATNSDTHTEGEYEIKTTEYYLLRRCGTLSFEKVPVDASDRMPDGHMDSIEPFDYKELKPFSTAYMPGFLADKYNVEIDKCGERMEERCKSTFRDSVRETAAGYDTVEIRGEDLTVKRGDVHYAMLPVWLLSTKWNGQNFLFAMNGQSGKLVGDLPVDKKKYWGYFGGISIPMMIIFSLINFLVLSEPMAGAGMVMFCFGLPLLTALIVCSVFRAQMKSVRRQSADAYITGSRLDLYESEDRYLRTTTERRKIETEREQ